MGWPWESSLERLRRKLTSWIRSDELMGEDVLVAIGDGAAIVEISMREKVGNDGRDRSSGRLER